jgi:hypothetical protein
MFFFIDGYPTHMIGICSDKAGAQNCLYQRKKHLYHLLILQADLEDSNSFNAATY